MLFSEASLKFEVETYVAVGCLDCPARQVLEYKQEQGGRPGTVMRAALVATGQCAVLKAQLPEGQMPPYEVTQGVSVTIKIDGAYPFGPGGGPVASIEGGLDPSECSSECRSDGVDMVAVVIDSVRGAIEQDQQMRRARGL